MKRCKALKYSQLGHDPTASHYPSGEVAVEGSYTRSEIGKRNIELAMSMFGYEIGEDGAAKIRDALNDFLEDVRSHQSLLLGRVK